MTPEQIEVQAHNNRAAFWDMNMLVGGSCIAAVAIFCYMMYQGMQDEMSKECGSVTLDEAHDDENPLVFFDISIGGEKAGTIVFELFKNVTPKTSENFRAICAGGVLFCLHRRLLL